MRLGCAALAMKRTARGAIRGGVAGKHWTRLRSPSGEEVDLAVGASDGGLTFVYFFKSGQVPSECTGLDEVAPERLPEYPVLAKAVEQITEYLEGRRTTFDLPLDLQGTAFQKSVWAALQEIPYGDTTTYGELAKRIKGGSPRAVGSANSKNPISICVPCHRVIGANKQLTGYSGGLENKKWLLDMESRNILKSVQKKRNRESEEAKSTADKPDQEKDISKRKKLSEAEDEIDKEKEKEVQ